MERLIEAVQCPRCLEVNNTKAQIDEETKHVLFICLSCDYVWSPAEDDEAKFPARRTRRAGVCFILNTKYFILSLMQSIKDIKDDRTFRWTFHAKRKLIHYGLSPSKVKNIIRRPERLEESIVEGLAAAMRPAGSRHNPYEIWVMFQVIETKAEKLELGIKNLKNKTKKIKLKPQKKIKIISCWRYPGTTKPGNPVPIPEDVISELGIEAEKVVGFSE